MIFLDVALELAMVADMRQERHRSVVKSLSKQTKSYIQGRHKVIAHGTSKALRRLAWKLRIKVEIESSREERVLCAVHE